MDDIKMCKCCIMHSKIPGITIQEDGTCSDCVDFEEEKKRDTKEAAMEYEQNMLKLFEQTKQEKHVYDAIVLFSGGKDSTQLINMAKNKYQLNVLGFAMQMPVAKEQAVINMDQVADKIGFDMIKMSIPIDTYKQYMRYALMNSDKYDLGENIGCAACSFLFRWYAYRLAIEMDIPIILDGRDKWQYGGFLYDDGNYVKEKALQGEKVFSKLHDLAEDALGITKGLMGYDIEHFRTRNFPSFIAPFTFLDYQTLDSLATIEELGLNRNNFETMYTNCDGIYLFDYITLKRFNCTSYHKGYAHGIRNSIPTITQLKTDYVEGEEPVMLTRDQTLKVLDEYKQVLFYMGTNKIGAGQLTDQAVHEIKEMIPYSTEIYGEDGIQMFIDRFTALYEYALYFDIDLDQITTK